MNQQDSPILWNRKVAPGIYQMGLACEGYAATALPGQFVMLHLKHHHPVLLPRPFSIHRLLKPPSDPAAGIEIIYKVVGTVTRRLARCSTGEQLGLVGPLGRGFTVEPHFRQVILAGGGMGIAPLYFLAQHLLQCSPQITATVFLGGRSEADVIALQAFRALHLPVRITTEDGSLGQQCLLTHPLEQLLTDFSRPDVIYACGPTGMLVCIADLSTRYELPCQVSMETMMACGLGACLGCACPVSNGNGYLHVCCDGPVIDAKQIDFGRMTAQV